jgi:hypothetical protein
MRTMVIIPEIATFIIEVKNWTGWSEDQPEPTTLRCSARRGEKLPLNRVGVVSDGYEVSVFYLGAGVATLAYGGLVVMNRDGSINLGGPTDGIQTLRISECLQLGTPTMDGGTTISLTLDGFE